MTTERWLEIVLGMLATLWGIGLGSPADYLGNIERYAALNAYLHGRVWGALLALCGLALLAVPHLRVRQYAHAGLAFCWTFIAILTFSGGFTVNRLLLGLPFVALAALNIYEYLRLSQLARL